MPRKNYKKKMFGKGGRRRLTAPAGFLPAALELGKAGYDLYKASEKQKAKVASADRAAKARKVKSKIARYVSNSQTSLSAADNIITLPPTIIGKQRALGFNERVARVDRPPILFKRNYQFNAEATSGRKAWFSFEFNIMNNNDLQADITTYKSQQYTDTAAADPTVSINSSFDGAKFYVDYLAEKLSFCNSSSNALSGKIHLFMHRRDNDNNYSTSSIPITPINLMLYYSTNRLPLNVTANEQTVGNGWAFNTVTSNSDMDAVYNMPGSSLNTSGVTAYTDLALSPSSPHIADSMRFWFKKVSTQSFTLKPGQQFNKSYVFNDLKAIMREEQSDYVHLVGVSFSCVVEFYGQIIGDANATTGAGVVSTGTTQLSCIRQSTRTIGVKNKLKSKIYLITQPMVNVNFADQLIINTDTGVQKIGAELDT